METTIIIPEPLVEAADKLAETLELSRNELYVAAIDAFIKSHQQGNVTEALDEVYAEESSEVDPVIMQMQLASLPREEW